MKLRFALSGSIVFETEADCVPPVGARVSFVMQNYKKGMDAGTLVTATITDDIEPFYAFDDGKVEVTLDVDHFETIDKPNIAQKV